MDGQNCKQSMLEFKCKKPGLVAQHSSLTKIASQTPEKISPSLHSKSKEAGEIESQQRYKTILQLFDGISSSLRLLGLSKKSPTFQNICTQVAVMTQREITYGHLAQIKYILPEVLQIDKILVHDKKTVCMKPEMTISFSYDIVEGHSEQSDFIALHQLFASRLVNYFTINSETYDIPEATLPEPFNQTSQTAWRPKAGDTLEPLLAHSSTDDPPISISVGLVSKSSHLHPLFSRHFSRKVFDCENGKTQLLASPLHLASGPSYNLDQEDDKITHHKNNDDMKVTRAGDIPETSSQFHNVANADMKSDKANECPCSYPKSAASDSAPDQSVALELSVDASASSSPSCNRLSSSVDAFVIETPAQLIPKRAMSSCDDKQINLACQKQKSVNVAVKRSLDFSCSDGDKCASECPEPFQKVEESNTCLLKDSNMNQFCTMRQEISVCLPDLVSQIYCIFQSRDYYPITKEELVHKLIINSLDFTERGEVEEHIEIVENLVPGWICKKLAPSGDILYNIKKMTDLESVLATVVGK